MGSRWGGKEIVEGCREKSAGPEGESLLIKSKESVRLIDRGEGVALKMWPGGWTMGSRRQDPAAKADVCWLKGRRWGDYPAKRFKNCRVGVDAPALLRSKGGRVDGERRIK